MSDVLGTAEKAVKQPVSWAKQNPWAFAFLLLVVVLVVLHFSAGLHAWIQARSAAGSKFWGTVGRVTGSVTTTVGVTALTILGILWLQHGGELHSAHDVVKLLMAGGLTLAGVAFPQTDYCALKDETGNYNSPIIAGPSSVERQFYLRAETEQFKGYPIKLTDVQFAVTGELTQAMDSGAGGATGSDLYWDELFAITDSFEMQSPRFGLICERTSISGPVWKHFVEYIGNGFSYSGDDPFATISENLYSSGGGDAHFIFTLYHDYPFMQRYLAKPDETAPFIGFLQNTLLKYRLAAATVFQTPQPAGGTVWGSALATLTGTFHVRAGYRYINGASGGGGKGAMAVPPLAYCRVLRIPAAGQIDVLFPQVHNQGPQNCDVSQGERLVAAVMLSHEVGLPGPCSWPYGNNVGGDTGLTEIGCEVLGIKFTNNPDMFVLAKLDSLRRSQAVSTNQGTPGAGFLGLGPYCATWPYTLEGPSQGANFMPGACNSALLGFPFVLPQVGTKISKMLRVAGNINVHMRQDTPPAVGVPAYNIAPQYCLYLHTLRDIDGAYAAGMLASAGMTGTVTRAVNHDADAAVTKGTAHRGSYVGIPQVIKSTLTPPDKQATSAK